MSKPNKTTLKRFKAVRGKQRPTMPRPTVFKDKTKYDRKRYNDRKEEW